MNNSVSYLTLFKTFMKIGIVTFGGGYAMIPIIESEVVDKHHWMTKEEFLDAIATTQICPGALAINMSSLLGYKLAKIPGAIVCTLGASLPSFLIILAIAMFFHQFEDNKVVAAMFAGIRPAVVALIAVPSFSLAKSAHISFVNCWVPILSALLIWLMGVNPIWVIIVAALGGYVYGQFIQPTEQLKNQNMEETKPHFASSQNVHIDDFLKLIQECKDEKELKRLRKAITTAKKPF